MLGGGITLYYGSTLSVAGNLTNSEFAGVDVEYGSTLQVSGGVDNSSVPGINTAGGYNTLTIAGNLINSANFVLNGPVDMATLGSLTNSGYVGVENGSTLQINGDASNAQFSDIFTGDAGTGGNTLNITGMLTNSGHVKLLGAGDAATIGNGVLNFGTIDVENGSRLTITGDVTNNGNMGTTLEGFGGGNTLNIMGNLTNSGVFGLAGSGDKGSISGNVTSDNGALFGVVNGAMGTIGGNLTNAAGGIVDVESGGVLQINGDVNNSGILATNYYSGLGGGNIVSVMGTLTNSGTSELLGPGDMATLGGLSNSGTVDVENGSTLQVNGDATNSGNLYTGSSAGGNTPEYHR